VLFADAGGVLVRQSAVGAEKPVVAGGRHRRRVAVADVDCVSDPRQVRREVNVLRRSVQRRRYSTKSKAWSSSAPAGWDSRAVSLKTVLSTAGKRASPSTSAATSVNSNASARGSRAR